MRQVAPAGGVFPRRGRLLADLLSHAPIPGEMQPDQRFTCFSSPLFSGNIESSNQNNAGPVANGATREKLNVPT